ncbi:hypothetical protein ACFQDR_10830 [Sulfitobacter sediminilitoris]
MDVAKSGPDWIEAAGTKARVFFAMIMAMVISVAFGGTITLGNG